MVHEPGDNLDAVPAQCPELRVVPAPAAVARLPRGRALPQHGIAKSAQAKGGKEIEIARAAGVVSGLAHLVAPRVTDPHDAALDATPELEGLRYGWRMQRARRWSG